MNQQFRVLIRWGDIQRSALQDGGEAGAYRTPLQDVIDAARDLGIDPRTLYVDGLIGHSAEIPQPRSDT